MRSAVELLVIGVCAALCACGDNKPNTPLGPANGGDGVTVVGDDTPRPAKHDEDGGPVVVDAGVDGGDGDGGVAAFNCERVQALASTGGDTPNLTSTDQPNDFIVVRQAVSWSSDCMKPVLTIVLSDGTCPKGAGHELQIALSVNDIEDGVIHLGENNLLPETAESASIRVRYTRPKRLRPNGTWGTCDAVTGQVTFLEAPQIVTGGLLQARYQFMLTPCDGSTNAPIDVFGAFKLNLRHDLRDVCPDRTR